MTRSGTTGGPSLPNPPSPALLADFPRFVLRADVRLWRLHRSDREPNWFTNAGDGRFDVAGARFGTCYLADESDGAFIEVFGRDGGPIAESDVLRRNLAMMSVAVDLDVADVTAPEVRGRFGLTGEVSAGGPTIYPTTQTWAGALHDAGFSGIRYRARHDPSLQRTSFALFGQPGLDDKIFAPASTWPVPMEMVTDLASTYGFTIVPSLPL